MKGKAYFAYKPFKQEKQEYDNYEGQQWLRYILESLQQDSITNVTVAQQESTAFLYHLRFAGKLKKKPTENTLEKYDSLQKVMKQQMKHWNGKNLK